MDIPLILRQLNGRERERERERKRERQTYIHTD